MTAKSSLASGLQTEPTAEIMFDQKKIDIFVEPVNTILR